MQHHEALSNRLKGLWEEESRGRIGDKQGFHGLAKARAQATHVKKEGCWEAKLCGGHKLPKQLAACDFWGRTDTLSLPSGLNGQDWFCDINSLG